MFEKLLAEEGRGKSYRMGRTTTVSIILHGALLAGMVYTSMIAPEAVAEEEEEDVEFVEIVEAEPPPPPDPTEAAPPPPPPEGFQELSVPTVIPPELPALDFGPAVSAQDFTGLGARAGIAAGSDSVPTVDPTTPTFTPYEVAPEVRNVDEVRAALTREYPAVLRDAGIGGTVVMWFFINDAGAVENVQVNQTSGFEQLDAAAMTVANVFEFTPAINQNEQVAVWVAIPITFTTN